MKTTEKVKTIKRDDFLRKKGILWNISKSSIHFLWTQTNILLKLTNK